MRFTDFLKATVLLSAAAASALAVVTIAGASADQDTTLLVVAVSWWVLAVVLGTVLGRRAEASPPIARLLANAKPATALPEHAPGRILVNRLWPLVLSTIIAGAVAFTIPQAPMAATGFALIWALGWRRQAGAVAAIEDRDGVTFFIERTSPMQPMQLVRAQGFKRDLPQPLVS